MKSFSYKKQNFLVKPKDRLITIEVAPDTESRVDIMNVSKVAQAIVWISVLTAIFGGVTIANEQVYIGIAFIIVAVFMYGFSYIVQAAYVGRI